MNTPRTQKELAALYGMSFGTFKRRCRAYGLERVTDRRRHGLPYILTPDEAALIMRIFGQTDDKNGGDGAMCT